MNFLTSTLEMLLNITWRGKFSIWALIHASVYKKWCPTPTVSLQFPLWKLQDQIFKYLKYIWKNQERSMGMGLNVYKYLNLFKVDNDVKERAHV